MEPSQFIVKHEGRCFGPFLAHETSAFTSKLAGDWEVFPLFVPRLPNEKRGPMKLQMLECDAYRSHVDSAKIDTRHVFAGMIQECFFVRRDERVFTAREILELWDRLLRVSRAVQSLMDYVDKVIAAPSTENLDALRKAVWRNRDSDDVDPHYRDRYW